MPTADRMPGEVELVRTTATFHELSIPPGLLASHRIAEGVWGRLVVESGSIGFAFEDDAGPPIALAAGHTHVIPPGRPHHLLIDGPVRFRIEFHR